MCFFWGDVARNVCTESGGFMETLHATSVQRVGDFAETLHATSVQRVGGFMETMHATCLYGEWGIYGDVARNVCT